MPTAPNTAGYTEFHPSWYQSLTNDFARIKNATSNLASFNGRKAMRSITTGLSIKISQNAHKFLEKLSPYQRIQITRKIASLSATPRPKDSAAQKGSQDIYCVTEMHTGFSISYKILAQTIYVLEIVPNPKLKGESRELPALYLVRSKGGNEWEIVKKPLNSISTQHAAINGQSNNLVDAWSLMAKHVTASFKKDIIKEYTLFHNPSDGLFWDTYESSLDKREKTTAIAKQFSSILNNVQSAGKPVKWVAHSQGGLIFTEAARYHWENHHSELSSNSVQFNAGANNEQKTKTILKMPNITILGFNNHPFDPVPNIIGGNAKDWVSLLGSTVGFFFVISDNQDISPHTLPYSGNSKVVSKVYNIKDKSALVVQSIINAIPK